jgi:RNA polymerase sigma factor (sigma-70 family)
METFQRAAPYDMQQRMALEHDAEWHAAFRRGEPDALTRVYREYLPPLKLVLARGFTFVSRGRLLRHRGCVAADLEDVVQEVFVRAFAEAARLAYDGLRPYRNYLFTIARNLVLQRARSPAPHMLPYDELHAHGDLPSLLSAPDRALDAHRKWRRLARTLTEEERVLLELRYGRQYSAERAAEALGWSTYRVKLAERRLRRSMQRLIHG